MPKGWKSSRFGYGSTPDSYVLVEPDVNALEDKEVSKQSDGVCTHESCGCGCYVATVDYDKLDQQ